MLKVQLDKVKHMTMQKKTAERKQKEDILKLKTKVKKAESDKIKVEKWNE